MLDRTGLGDLARSVAAMAGARSPSEVFRALLEGARLAAPRNAIFLLRKGTLRGWGALGYDESAARRMRALSLPAGTGWMGRLALDPETRIHRPRPGEAPPDFGQPVSDETVALSVRVGGRTVAVLLAEGLDESREWSPELLAALVTIAGLRLDLDVARRKLGATDGAATAAAAPPTARPATRPVAPADAGHQPTALAESGGAAEMPQLSSARRYARLIATDIRLYNEEAVMLGRRNRDLESRLGDHLDRGRETFERRYADLGDEGLEILHEAYVQVLAAGDAELIPVRRSGS